jgi:hypothetical protein
MTENVGNKIFSEMVLGFPGFQVIINPKTWKNPKLFSVTY